MAGSRILSVFLLLASLSSARGQRKEAALVIGGLDNSLGPGDVRALADVELFGCDNNEDSVIRMENFPTCV